MIKHEKSNLFTQDGVFKNLIIEYDGETIDNSQIYSESFELQEGLCSADSLKFGQCESSVLKFRITNTMSSLKDKDIAVSIVLNRDYDNPFDIGQYKVYSDVISSDRNYRDITAYDSMYYILKKELIDWYNGIIFPISLKEFRDSLFAFIEIEQQEVSLINDNIQVEKTITATSLLVQDILPYICEVNGVFGHINRKGQFSYVSLGDTAVYYLYQNSGLFPSQLYPGVQKSDGASDIYDIASSKYRSCYYEDFETGAITGVQIREEENDLGVSVGTDDNIYPVQGNFLLYGKEEDELSAIALRILEKIKKVKYTPLSVSTIGNLSVEVGDVVAVHTKTRLISSYVLTRTITGIQTLKDVFESKGVLNYEESEIPFDVEIKQLKGKANILERTLDSTRSEIRDIESGLSTSIKQNADSINAVLTSQEKINQEMKDNMDSEFEDIKKQLSASVTSEQLKIEIEKELSNGTNKVTTSTGVTVDENGLSIDRSDSEMKTNISHDGMKIYRNEEEVLSATNKGVDAVNLHATTYLIIGNNSRFEDYKGNYTACFWIGE
jgi:hypothetical protein